MIQTATIRRIEETRVLAGCAPSGGCKSCSGTFCSRDHESVFEVGNPNRFDLEPGDEVELYLAPGKTVFAGFMVLILPLLCFALGFALVERATDSDLLGGIGGLAGLGAAFLLGLWRSRTRTTPDAPVIRAVHPRADHVLPSG